MEGDNALDIRAMQLVLAAALAAIAGERQNAIGWLDKIASAALKSAGKVETEVRSDLGQKRLKEIRFEIQRLVHQANLMLD